MLALPTVFCQPSDYTRCLMRPLGKLPWLKGRGNYPEDSEEIHIIRDIPSDSIHVQHLYITSGG